MSSFDSTYEGLKPLVAADETGVDARFDSTYEGLKRVPGATGLIRLARVSTVPMRA